MQFLGYVHFVIFLSQFLIGYLISVSRYSTDLYFDAFLETPKGLVVYRNTRVNSRETERKKKPGHRRHSENLPGKSVSGLGLVVSASEYMLPEVRL